jgi:hypothetical protein
LLAIGVPAAFAAALAARGVLYRRPVRTIAYRPAPHVALGGRNSLIASLAAYVPAGRASRIDPVAAVKYE